MTEAPSSKSAGSHKLVIRNIGLLLSGDLEHPILDADTIVATILARITPLNNKRPYRGAAVLAVVEVSYAR